MGKKILERISPLLTDFYQISMLWTYWKTGRHNKYAVFDLFYRTPPLGGQYAVFAGLERVLDYLSLFCFQNEEVEYLKSLPVCSHYDTEFFDWLKMLRMNIKVWAPEEGTLMFPRVPLMRVAGPLCLPQLIETAELCLVNYATMIATQASRMRLAAGNKAVLMEFGLRRAPGPDGGVSASHYAIMGGFDSTSNVLAGLLHDLPIGGTHAHSFVSSYSADELDKPRLLKFKFGESSCDLTELALMVQKELREYFPSQANQGELAAFLDYAWTNPDRFLALIDTYNVETSGLLNYLAVSVALARMRYVPLGIRLDSGDLVHLSNVVHKGYEICNKIFSRITYDYDFATQWIVASNDISENILWDFRNQKHHITHFGIGTKLVALPALGGVYKLVMIDDRWVIKLSMDAEKMTIPGAKRAIRLYGKDGRAILDLLAADEEYDALIESLQTGKDIFCRHPAMETKRCRVNPTSFKELHPLVFDGRRLGSPRSLLETQKYVSNQLEKEMREDMIRRENPTPYKVSVTELVYQQMHSLMASEAPVAVLS